MDHRQITERIIGCAYTVYNEMGYGFLESVYEKCMLIELTKAKLRACAQKPITVFYEGHTVGQFRRTEGRSEKASTNTTGRGRLLI